jgi:hypothetical protein
MTDLSIQEAILQLIEATGSWNAFDGPRIVRDLRANPLLWRTAVLVGPAAQVFRDASSREITRADYDYSAHRGLPEFLYGYDTLQLTPRGGQEDALDSLTRGWGADSARWIALPSADTAVEDDDPEAYRAAGGDPDKVVLELWWD